MRQRTDVEFVIETLADGGWHSSHSILTRSLEQRGSGLTVNSRVSNARERGYAIEHRHDPTAGDRDHGHLYKLHGWFPPHPGCSGGIGVKHLPEVGWACRACHLIRRDLQPAANAQPTEGPGVGAGPETRGGSSETDEETPGNGQESWFADRAPVLTTPEAAGSTPAPRSTSAASLTRSAAEVISLLERRGFLEATETRIDALPPDPDQASLFDVLEEVA